MTLDQILNIQSIIDKRARRSDTREFLDKKIYSKSKQEWIRFGDMHFDHFISVLQMVKWVAQMIYKHVMMVL